MASPAGDNGGSAAAVDVPSPRLRHTFFARLEAVRRPPALTPRRVAGQSAFPGKATAVVGMRRAGQDDVPAPAARRTQRCRRP